MHTELNSTHIPDHSVLDKDGELSLDAFAEFSKIFSYHWTIIQKYFNRTNVKSSQGGMIFPLHFTLTTEIHHLLFLLRIKCIFGEEQISPFC